MKKPIIIVAVVLGGLMLLTPFVIWTVMFFFAKPASEPFVYPLF